MANGKEIKRRIKSINNTAKITKAMELISTVKMKKSQDLAIEKKRYILGLMDVFLNLSNSFSGNGFFKSDNSGKVLVVIVTSNKGLCGGYNINVLKKVNSYFKKNKLNSEDVDFVSLGKRGAQFVARTGNNLVSDFSKDFTDNIDYSFSKSSSRDLQEKFLSGNYSKVVVFYNHYVNTIKQIPLSRDFLPLTKEGIEKYFKDVIGEKYFKYKNHAQKISHTIEPSKEDLLESVLPMLIDSMFYDCLIESKASEHSSRMLAMKNATDNAKKFSGKLNLEYNKARQASITTEIGEIVSGVESMKEV